MAFGSLADQSHFEQVGTGCSCFAWQWLVWGCAGTGKGLGNVQILVSYGWPRVMVGVGSYVCAAFLTYLVSDAVMWILTNFHNFEIDWEAIQNGQPLSASFVYPVTPASSGQEFYTLGTSPVFGVGEWGGAQQVCPGWGGDQQVCPGPWEFILSRVPYQYHCTTSLPCPVLRNTTAIDWVPPLS